MKTIKNIGVFLLVLLGLFMLVGMYYGALFFWFVLKLMFWAVIIGACIRWYWIYKRKND